MTVEPDRLIAGHEQGADRQFDRALRPESLVDYIGQPDVKEQMEIFVAAAMPLP